MKRLEQILVKAESSTFYKWVLNIILAKTIPFNKPHRLKIASLTSNQINTRLPYIKNNKNHLNGIHACALAAQCEFTCGLVLARHFPFAKYRLIMQQLTMDYHYQGKTDTTASFSVENDFVNALQKRLDTEDAILETFKVVAKDTNGTDICTATVIWQLKSWDKVKTKR
ncbi:MAG: hypothetical protein ACJATA_001599 [Sphingobacteriales bacterium]|jgi:hypothetical protein